MKTGTLKELNVKPQPKVETVTLMVYDDGKGLAFVDNFMANPTHEITYTRTDGKPDPASIKMEEL